jgi:hypothetical protein
LPGSFEQAAPNAAKMPIAAYITPTFIRSFIIIFSCPLTANTFLTLERILITVPQRFQFDDKLFLIKSFAGSFCFCLNREHSRLIGGLSVRFYTFKK